MLKAEGDILLEAARNANGKDESWTNTNVTAGNVLAIQSGGDTTLKGAAAKADQIIASVGGNLLLESLQDSSKYESKNKSAGFGLTLCIPPYYAGSSSVSANASTGKMNSNFKTVTEQTGLWAGDGGFQIDVKNNTTLIGSVIASSDQAVADGLNKLTTGTLVTEDLKNTARYSGSQVSIGGGFGFGGAKASDSGLGTTKGGEVAGGASKDAGTSISTGSSGFGMGTPIVVAASGNSSSTTQSGISGGTIVIRDEAGQLALTGKTAAETIASLNRDTSDTLNALKPIFDKEKIEAGFEIASEAQRQMGQFLTNGAKEADALEKAMKSEPDPTKYAELKDKYDDAKLWLPGGTYRQIANAVMAATGNNVTGAASDIAQSAVVSYVQQLGVAQVGEWVSKGWIRDGSPEHAALQGIVGCAGAAASGQSCGAGATGGAAAVVINALLDSTSGGTNEERESRRNLVATLIAGAAAVAGADGLATITNAAVAELDNNSLDPKLHQSLINRLAQADQLVPEEYDDLIRRIKAAHAEGTQQAMDQMKSVFGPEAIAETRSALEAMLGSGSACGMVPSCALQLSNSIKELDSLLSQYETQKALTPKIDAGLMIFDLATSGILGAVRNAGTNTLRMILTRAAGDSLEGAAAKLAYADGAKWAVRNGEVLGHDGTVLARQNPNTGKYDAVRQDLPFGMPERPVPDLAEVWKLRPVDRGVAIEKHLAKTEYSSQSGWYIVGEEMGGYFPLVDFQSGNTLVSLKSIDTTGKTWLDRMESHIIDLGLSGATVNDAPANMVLDLRVQPGGAISASSLIEFGRTYGVTVIVKEFK